MRSSFFGSAAGAFGSCIQLAMVATTGLGSERFLETIRGSFRSNVDMCGASFLSSSCVRRSRLSVPLS